MVSGANTQGETLFTLINGCCPNLFERSTGRAKESKERFLTVQGVEAPNWKYLFYIKYGLP